MKLLIVALIAGALTRTTPAPVDVYTAYTPYGGAVQLASVDASTHDDDVIITMDDAAEIYISMERENGAYTLYTIAADGIHEIWMYGYNTPGWNDDIAADWQIWNFPTIATYCER